MVRRIGKKAQEDSQLNWIFILIAGALILAFFVFIVVKQKVASDAKFAGKVSQQLNAILAGAKVSSGSVQSITTPEVSIRFTCNDYYIGPASQRLGNKIVFAPEFLEGRELTTWTLDWNVPFKAATFLYVTNPSIRYVIVGEDAANAVKLFDALPKKLNKGTKVWSQAEYMANVVFDNDPRTRFIFVGGSFGARQIPDSFLDAEVSGLVVDMASTPKRIQFLQKSGTSLSVDGAPLEYLEDEILYGAIFSDKVSEFSCLAKRAYNRLNLVARVYQGRLLELKPSFAGTSCEGFYDSAELKDIISATDSTPPVLSKIAAAKTALKQQNKMVQLQSCPLIY